MNLNAIKALTGAGKFCTVMNAPDGKQWITEGHAAWLVEDVRMDAVKMCAPVAEWKVERGDDAESADGADEGGQERASEQIDIAEAMQIQKEEANA